jgi:hypothetical protein
VRAIDDADVVDTAQMVKLVDTPASGAGDRKVVEVRVFFWAPIQIQGFGLGFHKNPRKRVFAFLASTNLYSASISPLEAARGCDLLILIVDGAEVAEDQKITAFGSSLYLDYRSIPPFSCTGIPTRKAHMRNNIVYHCFKFLQCDSEEPCE